MKKAVLLLTFNRLSTTKQVLNQVRKAKPPRLYISSDGPRKEKTGEREAVDTVRAYILSHINWDCKVKTLFRKSNLGCGKAVSTAITWFFKYEKDGIILEDDCVPNQSFFRFCEELLDYHKDNKQIFHISGNQFINGYKSKYSYYYAKIQHCWGWATWADRWKYFELNVDYFRKGDFLKFSTNQNVQLYWKNIQNKLRHKEVDSWAYPWIFCIIKNNGLCINPSRNLVSNIGFGDNATHTNNSNDVYANIEKKSITTITHPNLLAFDYDAVNNIYRNHFGINFEKPAGKTPVRYMLSKIKEKAKRLFNNSLQLALIPKPSNEEKLFIKYKSFKRFVSEDIEFKGKLIHVPDVVSFAYQVKEIFINEIYKFESECDSPVVYDCGSNIGLSVLYFKQIYPSAKIKAFEADKRIYTILTKNLSGYNDIEIFHKAVWINESTLVFNSEGADGGSLINDFKKKEKVKAIRLKDLLENEESVDFLKIDIEGAETAVIEDCRDSLMNVMSMFIEYHSFINRSQELEKILLVLKKNGFRYYTDTINRPSRPFLLSQINGPMDLQVNIFATRPR